MHGRTRLRLQKIEYARRNMITTPEDTICTEGRHYDFEKLNMRGGTQLRLQKMKYARRNVITTPEDKTYMEGCDYDSRR